MLLCIDSAAAGANTCRGSNYTGRLIAGSAFTCSKHGTEQNTVQTGSMLALTRQSLPGSRLAVTWRAAHSHCIACSRLAEHDEGQHLLCVTSPAPHQVFCHPLARLDIKEVRCFADVLQPRLQQHCSSIAADHSELQKGPACVAEPSKGQSRQQTARKQAGGLKQGKCRFCRHHRVFGRWHSQPATLCQAGAWQQQKGHTALRFLCTEHTCAVARCCM